MNKKVKIALIFLGIILLAVAYFIWWHHQRLRPIINRKPTQFITIWGHLDRGLSLKISAGYATAEQSCWNYSEYYDLQPDFHELTYIPTVDDKNNYTVTIPLDGLQSGYCRWSIINLYSIVSNNKDFYHSNEEILIQFYDKAKPVNLSRLSIKCHTNSRDNTVSCPLPSTAIDYMQLHIGTLSTPIDFIKGKNNV